MPAPLAYFLTWTTYGTRLHGDARGTVDCDHNRPGMPFLPEDESRVLAMLEKMSQPQYLMDEDAQAVVQAAIREHAEVKGWHILALATPGTHVLSSSTAAGPACPFHRLSGSCNPSSRGLRERSALTNLSVRAAACGPTTEARDGSTTRKGFRERWIT
ncbi:MAG: hypothetical protein KIS87_02040 [Phycisphaeraceae bacterium]|nr:hypothetical protein [Phycisphaeraceae bacterium]